MNRRFRELLRDGVTEFKYYMAYHGGGGKGAKISQQPIVEPTPPVEEASVDLDEDKNKKVTGKGTLKIPLATSAGTGLNTSTSTGLKV